MRKTKIIILAFWICLFSISAVIGQNNHSAKLKAILIVGQQEDGTTKAISEMNEIAELFVENDVIVYKFYDKNANWNEITKVSRECSFLVYSGHGSNMGKDGNVGGICINTMVSTSDLLANLKLKQNSLVIFKSVCNGAGSSAGDDGDIGIAEAKKRVANYAYPFLEIGASGYYANNFGDGVNGFLKEFLSGTTLKQAYLNSTKIWTDVEFEAPFPGYPQKAYSIASSAGGGTSTRTTYTNGVKQVEQVKSPKNYDIAYVGDSAFSIKGMK